MNENPKVRAGEYLQSIRDRIERPPETSGQEGYNAENPLRRLTQHAVLLALDATQREMQDANHVYQGDVAVLQRELDVYFGGFMRREIHDTAAFDAQRDTFKQLAQTVFTQRWETEKDAQRHAAA